MADEDMTGVEARVHVLVERDPASIGDAKSHRVLVRLHPDSMGVVDHEVMWPTALDEQSVAWADLPSTTDLTVEDVREAIRALDVLRENPDPLNLATTAQRVAVMAHYATVADRLRRAIGDET